MTAQTTTVNYTPEQTAQIVNDYKAGVTVEAIATNLGKSVRSVVAKLSREGVYVAKTKAKAGARVTKAQLTEYVEDMFKLERGALESLQKGSHEALELLVAAVTSRVN